MTQEKDLIIRYNKGDREAGGHIVTLNEDLINKIYSAYFRDSGCPKDDLMQEGRIGLLTAVKKFNTNYESKFNAYKKIWIKKKMFDFRKKFFKYKFEQMKEDYFDIPDKENKMAELIFDLDNMVNCGILSKEKLQSIIKRI